MCVVISMRCDWPVGFGLTTIPRKSTFNTLSLRLTLTLQNIAPVDINCHAELLKLNEDYFQNVTPHNTDKE